MKVTVLRTVSDDYTYEGLEITLDGKIKFHVYSSESPEDNTLSRNFADCFDIPALLRKAWEAGQRGEKFEVEYIEEGDEEY